MPSVKAMVAVRDDICWATIIWLNTQRRRAGQRYSLAWNGGKRDNYRWVMVTHGDGVQFPFPNCGHDVRQNFVELAFGDTGANFLVQCAIFLHFLTGLTRRVTRRMYAAGHGWLYRSRHSPTRIW